MVKKMGVKVSIIIPVYNREKYIRTCVESILAQDLKEIEIICIDDGSNDTTPEILDDYAKKDDRVNVIHKTNTGYGNSVNIGIEKANGEYVAIAESDDFASGNMYSELYTYAKERNADIVKANFYVFYGDGFSRIEHIFPILSDKNKDLYNKTLNYRIDMRVFEAYMTSWSGIYKRSFLMDRGIRHNETPGASFQDNGFWIQTMLYANRIYFIDHAFYHLRRDNSDSSVYSRDKVFAMCNEYDFMEDRLREYGKNLDILLPWLIKRRLEACLAETQRIAYESRYDLIKRISIDFKGYVERDEIRETDLSSKKWGQICEMMDSPKMFYEKYFKISGKAVSRLEEAERIAVYGAGSYANKILGDLQTSEWAGKLVGIVVTNMNNNPSVINRLTVKPLAEVSFDKDTLIVIAVKDGQEIIEDTLDNYGFFNHIRCQELHSMI